MKLFNALWCAFCWREKYPSTEEVDRFVAEGRHVAVLTHDIGLCL